MTNNPNQRGRHVLADFAPDLVRYTDDVLFGDVWERGVLTPKERSLVTVACLVTSGNVAQLSYHLQRALNNGATREELIETLTHLAFYAGWPKAMQAMHAARSILDNPQGDDESPDGAAGQQQ
jgi:4-carboxymuconolactone decarboxylase